MCIKGIHLLCNRNSYGTVHCSQTLSPLITREMCLSAVADTVKEARYQARRNGRSRVVATDIRTALLDYQIPSDEAIRNAFATPERRLPGQARVDPDSTVTSDLQRRCNGVAARLQSPLIRPTAAKLSVRN